MPFTPFHMGPGTLIKAILQGSFSLMIFGWAQILMDIQPLLVLLTGKGQLHGFSHTYLGATLIAVIAALSGKYISEFFFKILRKDATAFQKRLFDLPEKIKWSVAISSALVGTFSHVLLDSLMHADLHPFYPFKKTNPLLGAISVTRLHQICIYSGLIGAVVYFLVRFFLIRRSKLDK